MLRRRVTSVKRHDGRLDCGAPSDDELDDLFIEEYVA